MSINERLKTIIEEQYNGNKRAFSMAIGVTPTVIENVVGSRQVPSGEHETLPCGYPRLYLQTPLSRYSPSIHPI